MKKIYSIIAVLACATVCQQVAAQKFVVYNKSGQSVEYNAAEVDSIVFVAHEEKPQPSHEYVDLGLPSGTMWAKYNMGATDLEEVGDYFAWGETTPKTSFTQANYTFWDANTNTYTKYNATDGKTTLDPEDDAATQLWGSGWSIPTEDQWMELFNNIIDFQIYEAQPRLGQSQYTLVAKFITNKDYILIPGQGYMSGDEFVFESTGLTMVYGMSFNSVSTPSAGNAPVLICGPSNMGWASVERYEGVNIRPVYTGN